MDQISLIPQCPAHKPPPPPWQKFLSKNEGGGAYVLGIHFESLASSQPSSINFVILQIFTLYIFKISNFICGFVSFKNFLSKNEGGSYMLGGLICWGPYMLDNEVNRKTGKIFYKTFLNTRRDKSGDLSQGKTTFCHDVITCF